MHDIGPQIEKSEKAVVAALDRLTEAVKGMPAPESEGDARSIAAGLVHAYDRWLAETPEPERIRDADMKLANVIRELRTLTPVGRDHPR